MGGDTQKLICHWHMQLSDPLYRQFSGTFLPNRLGDGHATVGLQQVVTWLGDVGGGRWSGSTRLKLASKLLSTACSAGLIQGKRDPRPIVFPLGLEGGLLNDRLKRLPDLKYGRQGDLVDMGWKQRGLVEWAAHSGLGEAKQRELAVA
jgi:hypothetical protein